MCQNETRDIRALLSEVADALEGMVWCHCSLDPGEPGAEPEVDSMAISTNATAIELLIRLGRLERVGVPAGRRVFARKPKQPGPGVI